MTPSNAITLPELPYPDIHYVSGKDQYGYDEYDYAYSKEQMKQYAYAAVLADRGMLEPPVEVTEATIVDWEIATRPGDLI